MLLQIRLAKGYPTGRNVLKTFKSKLKTKVYVKKNLIDDAYTLSPKAMVPGLVLVHDLFL